MEYLRQIYLSLRLLSRFHMKVVSFFNEKGGTGKSTLSAMFACYLRYKRGCPVVVIDFDHPNYQLYSFREVESNILKHDPNGLFAKMVKATPVPPFKLIKAETRTGYTKAQLDAMAESIRRVKDKPGYLILDFPGRFLTTDPAYYMSRLGLIDLFVMPVDSDRQSISSALHIINGVFRNKAFIAETHKEYPQPVVILPNKENQKERLGKSDRYQKIEDGFRNHDIPVTGARMRDILIARRDPNTFGFIRNTLCWPQGNINKACPYVESIFEEIKLRLDGKWTDELYETVYENKK